MPQHIFTDIIDPESSTTAGGAEVGSHFINSETGDTYLRTVTPNGEEWRGLMPVVFGVTADYVDYAVPAGPMLVFSGATVWIAVDNGGWEWQVLVAPPV